MRGGSPKRDNKWTRPRYEAIFPFLALYSHASQVADAVKRYSYLLGQTDLFRHFVDVQVRLESLLHPNPLHVLIVTFRKHAIPNTRLYLTQSQRLRGGVGKGERESTIPLSVVLISCTVD